MFDCAVPGGEVAVRSLWTGEGGDVLQEGCQVLTLPLSAAHQAAAQATEPERASGGDCAAGARVRFC